jgi:hypothetical protein
MMIAKYQSTDVDSSPVTSRRPYVTQHHMPMGPFIDREAMIFFFAASGRRFTEAAYSSMQDGSALRATRR